MSEFDVLLSNASIIDGTGGPPFRASVAIAETRIALIRGSVVNMAAREVVDVGGQTVAPGFIDFHSHSGLVLLSDPLHDAKIRQGVTTEVIGVDGNSYAPFKRGDDLRAFARLNAGLDGRPDVELSWRSVADYLGRLDRTTTVNIAALIGNSALRICVIGWGERPAEKKELGEMASLLREGMEEGAFGMSSGLDYPPGSYASTEELTFLSATAARLGGIYHTHVRYQLGDRYLDPFREALTIGHSADAPVHITHLYRRTTHPGGSRRILDLVEGARAEGTDVTFDAYPYEWSSTRLLILIPIWLQEGGPDPLLARLADSKLRPRIRKEIDRRAQQYGGAHVWNRIRLGYFKRPENLAYEGQTIAWIAQNRKQHPADAMCDLLVSEDLAVNQVAAGPDGASLPRFVTHPLAMVGSDSVFLGDRPSPRTFGSFPKILGELVREERLIGLPEAIRKMTAYPAQRLGLSYRGLVRDGMVADLVVFDPRTVGSASTYEEPRRNPVGITHVLVNGEFVVRDGEVTGLKPGRILKRGRLGTAAAS